MKTLQVNNLKNGLRNQFKIASLLIPQFCWLLLTGCWYTAISRYFNDGNNFGGIHEWDFSVSLTAFFNANKKTFVKDYGQSPETKFDYGLGLAFWTITKIDTTLSKEEQHDVRVDSIKVVFENFSKTFSVQNTFEDNKRTKKFGYVKLKYLNAHTEISVGSIYIPRGIQHVEVTVYGMFRSLKTGLEPFELSTRLKYKEMSERISKYD